MAFPEIVKRYKVGEEKQRFTIFYILISLVFFHKALKLETEF